MNVSCPECQSIFRVDPARIPGPGIRARCSVCGGIIPITAARSWTDDFTARYDAASLTIAASRTSGEAGTGIGLDAGRTPVPGDSDAPVTPPAGLPRSATPARVPPFVPGRRPTPPAGAPLDAAGLGGSPGIGGTAMPRSPYPTPPRSAAPVTQAPLPPAAPRSPGAGVPPAPPRTGGESNVAFPGGAPTRSPMPQPTVASPLTPGSGNEGSRPIGASTPPVAAPPRPATSASGAAAAPASAPGRGPINPFLANDPNQKAKRLARALVSDMVAYHPQKREEGLRAGTLKQLFREEIKKSYEEYVDQIGKEFAESTSHFQDALNDVLAGGKKVF